MKTRLGGAGLDYALSRSTGSTTSAASPSAASGSTRIILTIISDTGIEITTQTARRITARLKVILHPGAITAPLVSTGRAERLHAFRA
jgi:hypothetical protein